MAFLDVFRKPAAAAALLAGVALCLAGDAAPPKVTGWQRDVRTADAEARRLNVPLLLHFYADWCGPCKKMESEVLSSPGLTGQLGTRFVGVKINIDENRDLARQYKVESLPSDVVLAPDGEVLAHTVGYQNERDYLGRLARLEAKFVQSRKVMVARDAPGTAGQGPERNGSDRINELYPLPRTIRNVSDPLRTGEPAFIGLNGYSPVSLFHKRDWVKGSREHAAVFEGVVYQFATAEELREFEANPEKFAPRLLGCDPVVFSETERAIPGSTRFGAYFEGRLFLFVSSATRDQFRKSPERYGKGTESVSVDQIEYRRGP